MGEPLRVQTLSTRSDGRSVGGLGSDHSLGQFWVGSGVHDYTELTNTQLLRQWQRLTMTCPEQHRYHSNYMAASSMGVPGTGEGENGDKARYVSLTPSSTAHHDYHCPKQSSHPQTLSPFLSSQPNISFALPTELASGMPSPLSSRSLFLSPRSKGLFPPLLHPSWGPKLSPFSKDPAGEGGLPALLHPQ